MLKYGDKELFIELFLDSLNTVVENNVGLYKLEHKHTEFFKSFLSDTQGIEKIAIVGFSKEDTDYHLQPVLIQEDFNFIYICLSIRKIHRNSILSNTAHSSYKLYQKDAISCLTDSGKVIIKELVKDKRVKAMWKEGQLRPKGI
jgi:hypothetical protein